MTNILRRLRQAVQQKLQNDRNYGQPSALPFTVDTLKILTSIERHDAQVLYTFACLPREIRGSEKFKALVNEEARAYICLAVGECKYRTLSTYTSLAYSTLEYYHSLFPGERKTMDISRQKLLEYYKSGHGRTLTNNHRELILANVDRMNAVL